MPNFYYFDHFMNVTARQKGLTREGALDDSENFMGLALSEEDGGLIYLTWATIIRLSDKSSSAFLGVFVDSMRYVYDERELDVRCWDGKGRIYLTVRSA